MSLERAIADMKRFSQGEFSAEINFDNNEVGEDNENVTVNGFVSKHNLSINPETGEPLNTKNVHISVVESVLNDADYTTRNANREIDLNKHTIQWTDASGLNFKFLVNEIMPSETLGLIVITLGQLVNG